MATQCSAVAPPSVGSRTVSRIRGRSNPSGGSAPVVPVRPARSGPATTHRRPEFEGGGSTVSGSRLIALLSFPFPSHAQPSGPRRSDLRSPALPIDAVGPPTCPAPRWPEVPGSGRLTAVGDGDRPDGPVSVDFLQRVAQQLPCLIGQGW